MELDGSQAKDITQLLHQWRAGDDAAMERLAPLVHQELYSRAAFYLRGERYNHTLSTTALVNEAYIQIFGERGREWQSRSHFFAIAAKIMKNLLIQYAKARNAQKRGGGRMIITLANTDGLAIADPVVLESLDEGLQLLEQKDKRKARIVEMHFFGGMTLSEIAEVLPISMATIKRELQFSKAWLRKYLKGI